jgi:hypothetical protein
MLGKVFRIRGSNFRMLPKPTSDHWLKKTSRKAAWKITRLMQVFQEKLEELSNAEGFGPSHPVTAISSQWQTISALGCEDEAELSIETREAIHDALGRNGRLPPRTETSRHSECCCSPPKQGDWDFGPPEFAAQHHRPCQQRGSPAEPLLLRSPTSRDRQTGLEQEAAHEGGEGAEKYDLDIVDFSHVVLAFVA